MKFKNIFFITLTLVMFSGTASAAVLNVGSGYTYNTDGTADEVQINQAIQNAKPGDTVYLHRGTYSITYPIVMKSNLILKGDGRANTILSVRTSALPTFNIGDESIIKLPACKDVEIYGFTIDGNDGKHENCGWSWENGIMMYSGGSNVKIHDIYFTEINGDAIRTYSHSGPAYIWNIEVAACGHDAIRAQKVDNWHITNLTCDIYINYGVRFWDATNCSLNYSTFTAKVGSGNAAVGIEGTGAPGLVIDHCRFNSMRSYVNRNGIYVESGAGQVTVKNNIFWKCYDGGIYSETAGAETFIIENNIFDTCAYATSNLADAILKKNIISNSTSYAVKGRSSSKTSLVGNNIYGGSTTVSGATVIGTLTEKPGYTNYTSQGFIPLASTDPLYSAMSSWKNAGYGVYNLNLPVANLPVAAFSESPASGYVPLIVNFTDKTTNSPTSWNWNFGDGTTSTDQNITHTYSTAGNYTVILTASNAAGSSTATGIINVIANLPVAAFSESPASGYAPLIVNFTDKTTNSPTSWNWNFGDGTTSTDQNITHTYSTAGNYTVILTASNAAGSSTAKGIINVISSGEFEDIVSEIKVSDNRLREVSPDTVYNTSTFIDVGGMNNVRYRDLVQFDLGEYSSDLQITNAVLSLYWYYPTGKTRPEDTVIEIYRPASSWNSDYVSWNKKDKNVAWTNAGGDWYDKNDVLQGNTPYATITIKGSTFPENKYYELDVTDLVKDYTSGKYENTGFLIKARTENDNYIAFYSSDWTDENQKPKVTVTEKVPVVPIIETVTGAKDNRLREGSPETVLQSTSFIDVGGMSTGKYRDLVLFNLNKYDNVDIKSATLSIYWYYPAGSTRPQDTVIEIYRPASSWNPSYVSWNKRDSEVAWTNAGGDWYDKNGVLQGSTPYATITIKGSTLPDNKYYDLDITDLVKDYTSGKYEDTGFLIKARTESNNYIAFYSNEIGNVNQVPKLQLVYS